jgi:hypothetical protein
MLAVDLRARREFSLVLGFESLPFVPPGTATVEIISDVRRADYWHFSLRKFAIKAKYSTNFLILTALA